MDDCIDCEFVRYKVDDEPCKDCLFGGGETGVAISLYKLKDEDISDFIKQVCEEVKNLLLEKNKSYGSAVLDPVKIFSKTDALEQINIRIDDKLSRIMRGNEYGQEDTELDLIGYLILKRAVKKYMLEEL